MAIMREAARRDSGPYAARSDGGRRGACEGGGAQSTQEHGACRPNPGVGRIRFPAAPRVSAGLFVTLDEGGDELRHQQLVAAG